MEKIHALLEDIYREAGVAGMAVAITDREKTIFEKGFGMENAERPNVPVTENSMFRIASITKLFTGITILRLVEEGLLSLDAPVMTYVPELQLKDMEAAREMTLRQLLSHTAGLPVEYTPEGPLDEKQMEAVLLAGLKEAELIGKPGETYLYSNWGIRLASLAAQKVTGKLFSALVQTYVLEPLGMKHTFFDLHTAATYPLCLPHTEEDGIFRVSHRILENATRYAAGGLFSNARDLCVMARLLLREGAPILTRETFAQMQKRHAETGEIPEGYGITMMQGAFKDSCLYGHLGSAPPYATSLFVHPDSGYGVVTLLNTYKADLRLEIPKRILDSLTERGEAL